MLKISAMLDAIADRLESKGYVKEAAELDAISNTVDKLGLYGPPTNPPTENEPAFKLVGFFEIAVIPQEHINEKDDMYDPLYLLPLHKDGTITEKELADYKPEEDIRNRMLKLIPETVDQIDLLKKTKAAAFPVEVRLRFSKADNRTEEIGGPYVALDRFMVRLEDPSDVIKHGMVKFSNGFNKHFHDMWEKFKTEIDWEGVRKDEGAEYKLNKRMDELLYPR